MYDMGIRLSDKSGENRRVEDIDEMLDKINDVIADYDYRIKSFAEWHKFRLSCVKETQFYEENKEKWGVDLNE